jgi:hypothetical protein
MATMLTGKELGEVLESYLEAPATFQERTSTELAALRGGEIDG